MFFFVVCVYTDEKQFYSLKSNLIDVKSFEKHVQHQNSVEFVTFENSKINDKLYDVYEHEKITIKLLEKMKKTRPLSTRVV